jgi:hypothetical protein
MDQTPMSRSPRQFARTQPIAADRAVFRVFCDPSRIRIKFTYGLPLVALVCLIVLTVIGSHRYHSRTWSGRPGYQYQRAITAGVFGLWLTIEGAIGWDLSRARGLFEGTKWVDGPIRWQIDASVSLLAVATFLARKVSLDATRTPVAR